MKWKCFQNPKKKVKAQTCINVMKQDQKSIDAIGVSWKVE